MEYTAAHLRLCWPPPGKEQEVLELLPKLDPDLRAMLDAELLAGNFVVDATLGWMKPKGIAVSTLYDFLVAHKPPARVDYRPLNDPHWWKTEYVIEEIGHMLACPFRKKERRWWRW